MGQIKTVIHTFDNYYTHGKDYITFYYYIQNGFASIKEAEEFVMSAGEDPEWYVYVTFRNMVYSVGIKNVDNEIVMGKEFVYDRPRRMKPDEFLSSGHSHIDKSTSSEWTAGMVQDMIELNDGTKPHVICGRNHFTKKPPRHLYSTSSYIDDNAIILLGGTMFATLVPVYKLNSVDCFFYDSPSRWKMWESGVTHYNPYTGKYIKHKDLAVYTRADWQADIEAGTEPKAVYEKEWYFPEETGDAK